MTIIFDIILVVLSLILVVGVSLVIYARWNYGTLEAMGIPVVKPHWFLGSNYNYTEVYHHWEDVKRSKELGPIYGMYSGRNPEVFVTDPEMVRMVFLQNADHFANKKEADLGHPIINEVIELLNGEKAKFIKSILGPLLTTSKIKQVSETMEKLSKDYVGALVKDAKENGGRVKVNFKTFLRPFAIEVIGECLCGIKIENARDPNNDFINKMRAALWEDLDLGSAYNFTQVFPFLMKLFPSSQIDQLKFFEDVMKDILDGREKSGIKIPDTVNALLEMRQKLDTPEYKRLGITLNTVYAQAFEFFIASFLGIIVTYADFSYHIATNTDVNKKLMEEVDSTWKKSNGKSSYETVSDMHYLSACITETLRKTPSFFRPERVCTKDWEYKGYKIKKGTNVIIPIYPIHYNPSIYPEPEKFIPDRFLPENKDKLPSCSLLNFGQGARQCMGTRFVYECFKVFTLNLLKEFKIEKRSDTIWKEYKGNHMNVTKDPIYVDLVKRS